jgi:VanZ family protein
VIFLLSAQSGLRISSDAGVDGPLRHLAHIGAYGILAVLVVHGLSALDERLTFRIALTAVSMSVLYGVSDEIHQGFVPDRMANPIDVGYDAVGAAAGVAIAWALIRLGARDRAREEPDPGR